MSDGSVIPAEAITPPAGSRASIDILALPWRTSILRREGCEDVAIEAPGGQMRLRLASGTLLAGPVQLRYILEECRLPERLRALQRWNNFLRTGRTEQARPPVSLRASRRHLVVGTLDALAEGCSLRTTAIRLFGGALVDRDWRHPSDYLKLRTRRLVVQARVLAMGGYRQLL